ncbi:MAG TPA: four helix bundle protein [Ferruginibacter sp.]|nr:four helix bundle protein [Ferruginibacter sp.]
MTNIELKNRTKFFALRVIKLGKSFKQDEIDRILIRQLIRSSTSVAANYRAALRAKSKKDFAYKINIIEEEADESYFWLELIGEAGIITIEKLQLLINESRELTAIFTAQGKTAKSNLSKE